MGRNVIAEQINLIKLAEQSPSINRFFPSEYGTDIKYGPQSANEKPHQLKLKVRAYLESDAIKRLEYTYLVTGPYADLYIAKSFGDEAGTFDVKAKRASLLGDGNGKISLTTMDECVLFNFPHTMHTYLRQRRYAACGGAPAPGEHGQPCPYRQFVHDHAQGDSGGV